MRQDNALRRLSPWAWTWKFTPEERALARRRLAAEDEAMQLARATVGRPDVANPYLGTLESAPIDQPVRLVELVKRQGVELRTLFELTDEGSGLPLDAVTSTELEIKYAGYFDRERVQAERLKRLGHVVLAPDLQYAEMRSLTHEARQKLTSLRPQSSPRQRISRA